jgi:ABC-type sugar transport system permease subunit
VLAVVLNEVVHIRNSLRVLVYFPSALPGVATIMLWYLMFYPDQGGLLNMVFGWLGMSPYVWLMDSNWTILLYYYNYDMGGSRGTSIYYFAALQGVSRELYEAQ